MGHATHEESSSLVWRERLSYVLLIVFGVTLAVAANWPYRFDFTSVQAKTFFYEGDYPHEPTGTTVMAGWPMRYYQRFEDAGAPTLTQWSVSRLAINVAMVALFVVVLLGYQWHRQRRLSSVLAQGGRVTLLDMLVAVVLLASPLAYWQYLDRQARRDLALAEQIDAHGAYRREAMLPAWLIPRAPEPLVQACMRITWVRLDNPPSPLVATVLQNPHLRSLRIGGGDYSLRLLDVLPRRTQLHDVAIEGRALDAQAIQALGRVARLQTLGLRRTNVSAESLTLLDPLTRLRRLDLRGSDIQLQRLKGGQWSRRLVHLALPRPNPGAATMLQLEGLPQLVRLTCADLDRRKNAQPMQLVLADLPRLQTVELDRLQKFAVLGRNLPKLQHLQVSDFQPQLRIGASEMIPGQVWLSSLRLTNVPSLQRLAVYGGDLEELSVQQAGNWQELGIGVYQWDGEGRVYYDKNVPLAIRQSWIDGVARSDGPAMADLAGLPLQGVDLAPLRHNRNLRSLDLSSSGTNVQQWSRLAGMKQLESLNVSDCTISGQSVEWLTHHLPGLRRFQCDGFRVQRLRLEDRPQLAAIDFGDHAPLLDAVRLRNVPQLSTPLQLAPWAIHVHLDDVPALQGLVIRGPLPEGAVLRGFRDLREFAAGGAAVGDSVAAELLACDQLQQLSLAYTSVSSDLLAQLGNLPNLHSLDLTGSAVTDDVVADWQQVSGIHSLCLDHTPVTGAAVRRLLGNSQWKTLSLAGVPGDDADLAAVDQLQMLESIRLSGWQLTPATLTKLCNLPQLQTLDLSHTQIDAAMLDAMAAAGPQRLSRVILCGSTIDSAALMRLAQNRPSLRFDLTGADVSARAETVLASSDRILQMEGMLDYGIPAAIRGGIFRAAGAAAADAAYDDWPAFDASVFAPENQSPSADQSAALLQVIQ